MHEKPIATGKSSIDLVDKEDVVLIAAVLHDLIEVNTGKSTLYEVRKVLKPGEYL